MKKSILGFFTLITVGFGQFVPNISVATVDDANATLINSAGLGLSRDFNMWITKPTHWTKLDSITYDFGFYGQEGISGFGFTHMQNGRDLLHSGSGKHLGGGFYLGNTSHFSSDGYEAIDMGLLYRGHSWFQVYTLFCETFFVVFFAYETKNWLLSACAAVFQSFQRLRVQ